VIPYCFWNAVANDAAVAGSTDVYQAIEPPAFAADTNADSAELDDDDAVGVGVDDPEPELHPTNAATTTTTGTTTTGRHTRPKPERRITNLHTEDQPPNTTAYDCIQ
jgi:hypothetical protein